MTGLILQQAVNALTIGAIYALIALGYTMVYGVLRLINFAHGEMFMLGAYAALVIVIFAFPSGAGLFGALIIFLALAWPLSGRPTSLSARPPDCRRC
jgi:branched-chain amino acid transport system permease protein